MGKKKSDLTHEEIWDDSALVNSWNEAYEEYKHYHSLNARGEKVDAVLDDHEDNERQAAGPSAATGLVQDSSMLDDQGAEVVAETKNASASDRQVQDNEPQSQAQAIFQTEETAADSAPASYPMTQAAVAPDHSVLVNGSTSDPALKNLMMSWYWAGYYTGLHEGQRHAAGGVSVADQK